MSYATNRTLSANTNRLNLGTRTLANVAGSNDVDTSRFRTHMASQHLLDVVRAEVSQVVPSPSITPYPPKPVGGSWRIDGRKRGSNLGSSVSSRRTSSRRSVETGVQDRFSRFGFSAFDLSTLSLGSRSGLVMRPTPKTASSQAATACEARATRPVASVEALSGRLETRFLEPSASS